MALSILYAGSPEASLTTLKILFEKQKEYDFKISGILSNPPSAKGRHKTLEPTPVAAFAIENNIPVFTPEHLDSTARDEVSKLNAQLLICFAYGHIFGPKFLELFPCGGINLHPSDLPKYRGPTPIQNAILNHDDSLTITVQTLGLKMDEGDILEQKTIPLNHTETTGELLDLSAKEGAELICKIIENIKLTNNNEFEKLQGKPQTGKASYTQILKKEDAKINWNDSAENICAKIRAFNPDPGCFTFLDNSSIRILNAVVVNNTQELLNNDFNNAPKGKILKYEKSLGLIIKTSDGLIALTRLQKQGKKEMDIKDFMNGSQNIIGKTFSDL
ncbi:MAG: methionyl-tRNA formyltransferase [Spirochaetales bacterium]|nr:methionyl-tRNA formyltransferase [Spirochaetales bacterium]